MVVCLHLNIKLTTNSDTETFIHWLQNKETVVQKKAHGELHKKYKTEELLFKVWGWGSS